MSEGLVARRNLELVAARALGADIVKTPYLPPAVPDKACDVSLNTSTCLWSNTLTGLNNKRMFLSLSLVRYDLELWLAV